MALILLLIGVVLLVVGRFSFGAFRTEGKHVRAAGVVLMLPEAVFVVIGSLVLALFGTNVLLFSLLYLVQLLGMIAAVNIAYILIAGPPNAPRLPGLLGEIQAEQQNSTQQNSTQWNGTQPRRDTASTLHRETQEQPNAQPDAQPDAQPQKSHPLARRPWGESMPAPRTGSARPQQPARPAEAPRVMNLTQAALYLGVSPVQIEQWIEEGKLFAARDNGRWAIARSVLDDLKAELQPEVQPQPETTL